MEPEQTHQGESLLVACLLTFAAGLLDIYTYMLRGRVFANAITGNVVLLGMNLSDGEWLNCGKYLFAIFAYGAGILTANLIQERAHPPWGLSWKQVVLFWEIVVLLPVAFIPSGDWNLLVNGMISFICAMQVRGLYHHDLDEIKKAHHYYLVILCFVFGAVIGGFLFGDVSAYTVFIIPAVFCVVLQIISVEKRLRRK